MKNGNRTALIAIAVTVVIAIITGAVAYGEGRNKISDNTRRLNAHSATIKKLVEGQARIDERTIAIQKTQRDARQDVKEILRELRRPRGLRR